MSVSAQDLLEFHKKHLGEFRGTIKFDDATPEQEEDISLGFYPDGVERTLTDEQIEFFRQSDIRKEELRIYKENLALQEAARTQQEAQASAQAQTLANAQQAQDPTSQQTPSEEVEKADGVTRDEPDPATS